MHPRRLIATAAAVVVLAGLGAAAAHARSGPPHDRPVGGSITWTQPGRPSRPDKADWQRIRAAAHARHLALEPHRTAHYRSYAAFLGVSELVTIHPLGPGACATAVNFLYDNLLDLQNAYDGENWNPLRRLVAKGPSIRTCAPRKPDRSRP